MAFTKEQVFKNIVRLAITKSNDTVTMLKFINRAINSNFKYIPDTRDGTKKLREFFKDGGGDCEDFSHAKRKVLDRVKGSIDIDLKYNMYICMARKNTLHCVLRVEDSDGNEYYLDNFGGSIEKLNHKRLEDVWPKHAKDVQKTLSRKYTV